MSNLNNDGSDFRKLWETAWQQYVRTLPPKVRDKLDLEHPKWLNIKNVDDLASMVESEHEQFNKDTSRDSTVSEVVKGAFGGLNRVIDIIGGAAGAAFPPCSQALGAIKVLIDSGLQVSKSFDAVSGMFDKIGGFLKRLGPLSTNKIDPPLEEILRQLLICMLKISSLATRRACSDDGTAEERTGVNKHLHEAWQKTKSKTRQYFRQLVEGGDKDITAALNQLESLVDAEVKMTNALVKKDTTEIKQISLNIQQLSIQIGDEIFEMRSTVLEIAQGVQVVDARLVDMQASQAQLVAGQKKQNKEIPDKVIEGMSKLLPKFLQEHSALTTQNRSYQPRSSGQAEKSKEQSEKLRKALDPPAENIKTFEKIYHERLPGTGNWFLELPLVKKWMSRDIPILLVTADRGSGKTFVASGFVHELQTTATPVVHSRTMSSAYFFCKRNITDLREPPRVLRSLAFQIAESDKLYTSYITSKPEKDLRGDHPVQHFWNTLIHDYFGKQGKTSSGASIVIDGIDECSDADVQALLNAICETSIRDHKWQLPNVQILMFISTKSEDAFKAAFGTVAEFFPVTQGHTKPDMDHFIDNRLSHAWDKSLVSKSLREKVQNSLVEHCTGNFLWTSLVLGEIVALSRESDIHKLLEKPPVDVREAVLNVLKRVERRLDDHGKEDLNDILSWVSNTDEYLTLRQLDALLYVREAQDAGVDGARVINLEDLLRSDYSSLFVLSSPPSNTTSSNNEQQTSDTIHAEHNDAATNDAATDAGTTIIPIPKREKPFEPGDVNEVRRKLASMDECTVRLISDLEDQLGRAPGVSMEASDGSSVVLGDLSMQEMRVKTLLASLKIMCDDTKYADEGVALTAYNYCAKWLPEHLINVDPAQVDPASKRSIEQRLLRLLRDDAVIDKWIAASTIWMTSDLLEKPDMARCLLSWIKSLDCELEGSDREWVEGFNASTHNVLFAGIARGHARRWLQTDPIDISLHFEFIKVYIDQIHSQVEEPAQETRYVSLYLSSVEEITKAAEWADFEQTSRWCHRVAEALREGAGGPKLDAAIVRYSQAVAFEDPGPEPHYGLFWCYWYASFQNPTKQKEFRHEAIHNLEIALDLYKQRLSACPADGKQARNYRSGYLESLRYLASVYETDEQIERSKEVYDDLMAEFQATAVLSDEDVDLSMGAKDYFDYLFKSSMFDEAANILQTIVKHPSSQDDSFYAVYWTSLYDNTDKLKVAYQSGSFDILNKFWSNAVAVIGRKGDDGEIAGCYYRYAMDMLRMAPLRKDDAVAYLKKAYNDDKITSGANAWHWVKDRAARELARIHSIDALEARDRDRWQDVSIEVDQLRDLAHVDGSDRSEYKVSDASLILAAWNQKNGRPERAKRYARPTLKQAIDMLYNAEESDDYGAWVKISNTMLVVGDSDRAKAAWGVLGSSTVYESATQLVDFEELRRIAAEEEASVSDAASSEAGEDQEDDPSESIADTVEGAARSPVLIPVDSAAPAEDTEATENKPADIPNGTVQQSEQSVLPPTDPNAEQSDKPEETTKEDEPQAPQRWTFWCDGPCFETFKLEDSTYRCVYCITDFCASCYRLVRDGGDPKFDVCSRDHDWCKMDPIEKLKNGKMKYKGEEVDVQEWLDELAAEWHIPRVKPEDVDG